MPRLTRRRLLYQTSISAAAVSLLPAATRFAAVESPPTVVSETVTEGEAPAGALSEPLVAVLHPSAQGELSLMAGVREIVIHDADLIARLVKAAL